MSKRGWWRADTVLALLLGALVFLPGLGAHDLWNPDEPRYAEVAREMLATNTAAGYLVPHLNGEIYAQKPPLLFWLMCARAALAGGLDETTARLPLGLSAIFTLPLLLHIGRTLFDRRAAWLAVAVFASCVNLLLQARTAQIDMLLVCLVTLSMQQWVCWLETRRPGHAVAGFAAAGCATLAKGPVGLLPPLLALGAFLVVSRQRERLRDLSLGIGLVVWAAIVAAWLVPAVIVGGAGYARSILLQQNVERFVDPTGHLRPWYYYLEVLPFLFFPWFFFVPGAVALGLARLTGRERRGFLLALCWIVVTIVFFSLSPGKRTVYVLTMYPAMALVVGVAIGHLARSRAAERGWLTIPLTLLAIPLAVATAAALAPPRFTTRFPEIDVLGPALTRAVASTIFALALGAAIALGLAWARRPVAAFVALAAGSATAGLLAALVLLPPFDAIKSARGLANVYRSHALPDEPYGLYPRLDPPFLFYTQRFATVLRTGDELRAFAERPGRVWVFAEERFLRGVVPAPPLIEVARDRDPRSAYVLLTSRALAAESE